MQGCKRGAVNAYLCIANEPALLCLMDSVMLRDTTDKLKVMYTEMTARLIVHLMSLLRSLLGLNGPPPQKNSLRYRSTKCIRIVVARISSVDTYTDLNYWCGVFISICECAL
jgi:hypothetical protein